MKRDRLAADILGGGAGGSDPLVYEVVGPENAVSPACGAVTGSGPVGFTIEFPPNLSADTLTHNT